MGKENKFYFDLNNFDAPVKEEVEEIVEEEEVEPPPPTFSEDELDAAKAVAHATGRNEGMQEEKERREQHVAEVLQTISKEFSILFAAEIYRERQYEEESVKLGMEILSLLAPSLNERLGKESLKSALLHVLKSQAEQAEIRIEVHPETAPDIDALIENIWPDKDIAPNYKVVANTALEKGTCSLSWKDGGMIRDTQKTANDIKTALETLLVEHAMDKEVGKNKEIRGKKDSSLTAEENNAIKDVKSPDSSQRIQNEEQNGEKEND